MFFNFLRCNLLDIHILNWNNFVDTKECLNSILKYDNNPSFRLFVIDNNSELESFNEFVIWADEVFKNVRVIKQDDIKANIVNKSLPPGIDSLYIIRNHDNLGFANGNNVGLSISKNLGTESVLLLNNDTLITKNAITTLYEYLISSDVSVVTPQIRFAANREVIWNCGGKFAWHGNRKYFYNDSHISSLPSPTALDVQFVTGCCLMYDFKNIGFLSEKFFFGEEDFEFSLRCQNEGYKIKCILSSVIYHKVSASRKLAENREEGSYYLHQLQRVINVKNFFSPPKFYCFYILMLIAIVGYLFKRKSRLSTYYSFLSLFIKESLSMKKITKSFYLECIKREFE
jgi:GT2 family glycosyltransferase